MSETLTYNRDESVFEYGDWRISRETMELAVQDYTAHGRSREHAFLELLCAVNWKSATQWHQPYFYEHWLIYQDIGGAVDVQAFWFRTDAKYDFELYGHFVEKMPDEQGVFIFQTPEPFDPFHQEMFEHERALIIYDIKHDQSFPAYMAWLSEQDEQTRTDYFYLRRSLLAEMDEQEVG
jgi:hypothetical protein